MIQYLHEMAPTAIHICAFGDSIRRWEDCYRGGFTYVHWHPGHPSAKISNEIIVLHGD